MSIKQLNPYIHLNGTAEKAIKLYESALGAKTEGLMRWSEMPGENVKPEHKNLVMHSRLKVGGGVIMVSDALPGMPVKQEAGVEIMLDFTDVAEMKKCFDALASGGTIAIQEFLVNPERTGPPMGLIFAVNMLINTDRGDTWSFEEIAGWLKEAGFTNARTVEAPGPSPLILATKP